MVSDELFQRLLEDAYTAVTTSLANAGEDSSFAVAAIRRGFVLQARDLDGKEGWVPVDVPGMWPVERLMALAAADFLTRPQDYERGYEATGTAAAV